MKEEVSNIQLKVEKDSSMQLLKEEKASIQLLKDEKVNNSNQLIKAFDPNLQLHWMKMDMLTKKVTRALIFSILCLFLCVFCNIKYFAAQNYVQSFQI